MVWERTIPPAPLGRGNRPHLSGGNRVPAASLFEHKIQDRVGINLHFFVFLSDLLGGFNGHGDGSPVRFKLSKKKIGFSTLQGVTEFCVGPGKKRRFPTYRFHPQR